MKKLVPTLLLASSFVFLLALSSPVARADNQTSPPSAPVTGAYDMVQSTAQSEALSWSLQVVDSLIDNADQYGITSNGVPIAGLQGVTLVAVENLSEAQYAMGQIPFGTCDLTSATIRVQHHPDYDELRISADLQPDGHYARNDVWTRHK